MTKEEALQEAWSVYNTYPGSRTAIIAKLPDYGISLDEFNTYDSTMLATAQINVLEERAELFEDIPAFSQSENISDTEILRVFEDKAKLNAKLEEIGKPPTEAEWYKAGLTAEKRIEMLRPFYETKKAEEWERLEHPFDPIAPLMGPLGLVTEIAAGWSDFGYDFGEKLHERGAFTSWNPLTGFGAWDIAEFKQNPRTGESGFSPQLLAMEKELEALYGTKRQYESMMTEGGYRDAYNVLEEIRELDNTIMENKLLDPRLLGETQ